ncbi:uracil-DNA glycosylase [Allosphingosinicella flava]|uniref:Uracil-DNA glycosylase n=1 Tax=Allosphingosinicella flava TaxID=2771430 RepID=A0A7T2GL42_9SPHN|nr:uracil-DNA glycosylase [Sphingosinicella flava]QPQ55851.1 uracil-DNA glycosylase [Sphingosinicella flava]
MTSPPPSDPNGGVERGSDTLSPATAMSALQWWIEAGVDTMVSDEPRDWLRPVRTPPVTAPAAPEKAHAETLPEQIDLFQAYLRDSDALPLATPGARRVCPSGDPASGLMMMVDMPAEEDCASGALLAGDVGQLFDRMLAAIGRGRQSVYLASLACFRTPAGTLTDPDAARCTTLARHHIGLAAPQALLLFGDACARALTGLSVAQARGRWHDVQTHAGPIPALVTLNPAQLLAHPRLKAHAWADLQMLMKGPPQ